MVFNYGVRDTRREIGLIDVVWGASSPSPRRVFNQFYTPFERDGIYGTLSSHSLSWWKRNHPDWIEYRCDRKRVAYEFGDSNVPLDIANPEFLKYQRSRAVDAALAAGYNGIAFDNLSLGDFSLRCGHFNASGQWVQQYRGSYSDPAYRRDVIAWATGSYAHVHAYSSTATMAINYSYDAGFSFGENYALMTQTDEVLDERGYTDWGEASYRPNPARWSQITRAIGALQRRGTCYTENGEEPARSHDVTQEQRLWVVSNYLVTRDDCTYVWISGFSASGAQQYGQILIYPEYRLAVGAPSGSAVRVSGGWQRAYSNGLALVNPSLRPVTFALNRKYVDENGAVYSRSIVLQSGKAQVLLDD